MGGIAALLVQQMQAEEVWIGTASGKWSDHLNWLDGSAPLSAGDEDLTLRFTGGSNAAVTASNDLEGIFFALNKLILEHTHAYGLRIGSYGPGTLKFTGVSPVIQITGAGNTTISAYIQLDASSGELTVQGNGVGNLTISSALENSPGQGLVIDAAAPSWNAQLITFSDGPTNLSGDITLQRGNLAVSGALGTGNLIINGGTLRGTSSFRDVPNAISLGADLVVTGTNDLRLTGKISSASPATGLSLRTGPSSSHGRAPVLTLPGASTYTGATTIDFDPSSHVASSGGGTIELLSSGSLLGSSRYDIRSGGTLRWSPNGTGNALGDSTPINLHSGQLQMTVNSGSTSTVTEVTGALSISGANTITIQPSTTSKAKLALTSLTRNDRGTVFFRGAGLGSALAPGVGNIVFSTAPAGLIGANGTGVNRSILPYAVGDTSSPGSGFSFVTYDPTNGIRPLDLATEYATTLPAGGSTANVRLGASLTLANSVTINSLVLAPEVNLSGNAKLSITSGAVMALGSTNSVSVPIAFGGAEANFFTTSNLILSGALSGSNGLTKSGDGTLTLAANNTIAGPLTINAGAVAFSSAENLGSNTAAIVLNGVNPAVVYQGGQGFTLARPIEIKGGIGRLESTNSTLLISTPITGSGGLEIGGGATGVVRTLSQNTYSGPTILSSGTFEIASDAALGQGGLFFGPNVHPVATLRLLGNWTTSREVRIGGDGNIDTAGFDASLSGVLTGARVLIKKGSGTLTLGAASPFTGELTVSGGSFRLADAGQVSVSKVTLQSGGHLVVDNSTTNHSNRLGHAASVSLAGGELQLTGNSAAASAEKLAAINLVTGGMSTVTLEVPGSAPVTLNTDVYNHTFGYLLVRGDRLGGAADTAYSRLVLPAAPESANGFLSRIYAADRATGGGESLAVYDATADPAGTMGVKALPASAYVSTSEISNPNVPAGGNVLVSGSVNVGAANAVAHSVTLDPASSLDIATGKTLTVGSWQIVARSGGGASAITGGGVLDFGTATGTVAVFGDLTMDVAVAGTGGWVKTGPGTLSLGAQTKEGGARLTVNAGAVKPLTETSLGATSIDLDMFGTLNLESRDAQLGGVSGTGKIVLGASTLTLGTVGANSSFSGSITGTGTLKIVDGGSSNALRTFASPSPLFSGTLDLRSGLLDLPTEGKLGSGIIQANGGGLYLDSPLNQSVVLNSNLRIRGGGSAIQEAVSMNGPGGLMVEMSSELSTRAPLAYTGETSTSSALRLVGANGALTGTSKVRVFDGGQLLLDNWNAASSRTSGRLPDTVPVWLENGRITLISRPNESSTERFGELHVKGVGLVEVYQSYTTSSAVFRATRLVRENRATVAFQGIGAPTTGGIVDSRMFFDVAPPLVGGGAAAGPNTSIIPWASADASTLVTYSPTNGVRPLDNPDFVGEPAAVKAPTNNLLLSSATVLTSPLTINSLVLRSFPGSESPNLSGSGALQITSGAMLSNSLLTTTVSVPLNFGGSEAHITVGGGYLTVSGPITGSGGLTKAGGGSLALTGASTISGPISINQGTLYFASPESLGAEANPISLQTDTRLVYNGSVDTTLSGKLNLEGGASTVGSENTGITLTIAGEISGGGDLEIYGPGKTVLTGANTYTGATHLYGDTVITSDASFGNGGSVYMYGHGLKVEFPWNTSRPIMMANGGYFDTGANDVALSGPVSGNYGFTKTGTGSLTIRNADALGGRITVATGSLVLEGSMDVEQGGFSEIEVSAGGRLSAKANLNRDLNIYGTLAPGVGVGSVSAWDVKFRANSKLELELVSAQQYDRLIAAGMVQFEGLVNLALDLQFDPVDGVDSFLLIDNDGTDPVNLSSGVGKFANLGSPLNEGSVFFAGAQPFRISYSGGDGNDVVLYAVPEPASAALLAWAGLMCGWRRKKRG